MDQLYPDGPAAVAKNLTAPGPAYKRRAQLAFASLLLFIALYFSLTGWFAWTSYSYFRDALAAGSDAGLIGYVLAIASAFLTVFLVKALFFVDKGGEVNDIEVTPEQQPKLFEFLYRLADDAGAPRPHRVFLSPRVNAAVFYDLTLLNLLFPSKKNLEIGLALVNGLNLGEMKAVLAHEFGHFQQGSMAIGRWVYVAQQVATHLIYQRDMLDNFLLGLSRIDIRIAWIGWILRLIVWALRAILDSVFSLVVVAQRSLSREMEFHADLVSVSLSGSDALIHALHRLHAADDAWSRALNVAGQELSEGRVVSDIFVIQKIITQRMKDILDDENYDSPPALPEFGAENHRVFDSEAIHPPQMWATHPPNSAREENAKKTYIPCPIDERPAWDLFENPQQLREQMTEHILSAGIDPEKSHKSALTESVDNVNKMYSKAMYKRRYRGAYMGRSVVREVATADELFGEPVNNSDIVAALDALYPEDLPEHIEHWRNLEEERANLQALYDGTLTSPDGVIRHRGEIMKRKRLPKVIRALRQECDEARADVCRHDRLVRSTYRAAAQALGNGWPEHHAGLAQLLHYADHSEANLSDAQIRLNNLWSVVIADGKVSSGEVKQLLGVTGDLWGVMVGIENDKGRVELGGELSKRLGKSAWSEVLGEEFGLPAPTKENLGDWLQACEGWIHYFLGALSALRLEALEALLDAEAQIDAQVRSGQPAAPAPAPGSTPREYATLTPGSERKLQTRLGAWDRFQTADGLLPGLARFVVAIAIVGSLLGVGIVTTGGASVMIYNGLATQVTVVGGGDSVSVPPLGKREFSPDVSSVLTIETRSADGSLIESFNADASNGLAEYVYNVAGAAPMIEWTQTYGNALERDPVFLGTKRWFSTSVDHILEEPPDQISTSGDGGTRTVLTGLGEIDPRYLDDYMPPGNSSDEIVTTHATWDNANADMTMLWMSLASERDGFDEVLEVRLSRDDDEILSRRFEQDMAPDDATAEGVCSEHTRRAAEAPGNASWQYLATRCIDDEAQKTAAYIEMYEQGGSNGWVAGAAGYSYARLRDWQQADAALVDAWNKLPAMRVSYGDTITRVRRMLSGPDSADVASYAAASPWVDFSLAIEAGANLQGGAGYVLLADGDLEGAVAQARADGSYPEGMLRYAAASDGAPQSLVSEAAALGVDQGIDLFTIWPAVGFAIRHGLPTDALLDRMDTIDDRSAGLMRNLVDLLSASRPDPAAVETVLDLAGPDTLGRAYAMAAVALGDAAPADWRENARRLLLITERPYFR